jgi:hypothetical protein
VAIGRALLCTGILLGPGNALNCPAGRSNPHYTGLADLRTNILTAGVGLGTSSTETDGSGDIPDQLKIFLSALQRSRLPRPLTVPGETFAFSDIKAWCHWRTAEANSPAGAAFIVAVTYRPSTEPVRPPWC